MRSILPVLIIFYTVGAFAQETALDAVTNTLSGTANIINTTSGTYYDAQSLTNKPETIAQHIEEGNLQKTAQDVKKTAQTLESAVSGVNALTGSALDVGGTADALKETGNSISSVSKTISSAEQAEKNVERLEEAIKEGDLGKTANALSSLRNTAKSGLNNLNKIAGTSVGNETIEIIQDSLKGTSTKLNQVNRVHKDANNITNSAEKIKDSIDEGNIAGVASGLSSLAKNIKTASKDTNKALGTGSKSKSGSGSGASSGGNKSGSGSGASAGGNKSGSGSGASSGGNKSGSGSGASSGGNKSGSGSGASSGGNKSGSDSGASSGGKKSGSGSGASSGGNKSGSGSGASSGGNKSGSSSSTNKINTPKGKTSASTKPFKANTQSKELNTLLNDVSIVDTTFAPKILELKTK